MTFARASDSGFPFDFSRLARGERVLVALSGGADSVALLLALHRSEYEIVAAHVDHGLRGRESDDDELFARQLCASLGIEYSMRRVVVARNSAKTAMGENATSESATGESAARQARYAALVEMARERNCTTIVTAHTADDNLETVLLHMARGASVEGWSGIPPERIHENGVRVVRPFLGLTRAQTEAICRENHVVWRDDSSNSSTRFARNRVRNEIVPLLAEIGHKSRETLARQTSQSALLRRDESDFLDELATAQLEKLRVDGQPNALTLDGEKLVLLSAALQRRVLRIALRGFDARDLGHEQLEEVRRHISQSAKRRVWCLARGVRVEWTGAMSGNRVRLWRVGKSDTHALEPRPSLL